MARHTPVPVTARLTERETAQVEIAARIRGLTRSAYVRKAVTSRAEQDLARLAQGTEPGDDARNG